MRTVKLSVEVDAPDHISDSEVARLVDRVIDNGYEVAMESLDCCEEFDDDDPKLLEELDIGEVKVENL